LFHQPNLIFMMKSYFLPFFLSLALFSPSTFIFAQCPGSQHELELEITLNGAWYDISWQMVDQVQGTILQELPNFPINSSGQTFDYSQCIDPATIVRFHLYDTNGYGLCCRYQKGAYTLSIDGQPFFTGGSFFRSQVDLIFQVPLPALDASLFEVTPHDTVAAGLQWVRGKVVNTGQQTINSLDISWTVDEGQVHSHLFQGLAIAPGETFDWEHPWGWEADDLSQGHDLTVWIDEVNGQADAVGLNDSLASSIKVFEPLRNVLVEYLSNFYCGPCKDAIEATMGFLGENSSYAFGMGVHSSGWGGRDILYQDNPIDLDARYQYLRTTTHPNGWINGEKPLHSPNSTIRSIYGVTSHTLREKAGEYTPFEISIPELSYDPQTNLMDVNCTLTHRDGGSTSSNLRAQVVVIERDIDLPGPQPNGEEHADWILRKMLPTFSGTPLPNSWSSGQQITLTESWSPDNLYITQNMGVLVFIEDFITKEVWQVNYRDLNQPQIANNTNLEGAEALAFTAQLSPNPAGDWARLTFSLEQPERVEVSLFNMQGQQVMAPIEAGLDAGQQGLKLPLGDLSPGLYLLSLRKASGEQVSLRLQKR
jgi:hypothetical protein